MTAPSASRRWPRLRATVLLCAAAIAAAGCRDDSPVRIGVAVGIRGVPGAEAAAEAINAEGGIGGRTLELVVLADWAVDADMSIRAAEMLADDRSIVAVVGHGTSAASLAASQVYNDRGLVHLAPTSTATLLSLAGPYSFRLVPGDTRQAAFLVSEARRLAAAGPAAILYENSDYGRGLNVDLTGALEEAGIPLMASIPFVLPAGSEALRLAPRRFARNPPAVVFYLGGWEGLDTVLASLFAELPDVVVMAADGAEHNAFYSNPAAFAGLHFVRFVDPASLDACIERLRVRSTPEDGGLTPNVLAYDAVVVLAAVLRSGARTRGAVQKRLAAVGNSEPAVAGCAGPIGFDAMGDVLRPYQLARVDASGVTLVSRSH